MCYMQEGESGISVVPWKCQLNIHTHTLAKIAKKELRVQNLEYNDDRI